MNTIKEIAKDILTSAAAGSGYAVLKTLGEKAIEKHKPEWKDKYRAFAGIGAGVTGAGVTVAHFIKNITQQKSFLAGLGSALLSGLAFGGAYWGTSKLIDIGSQIAEIGPGAWALFRAMPEDIKKKIKEIGRYPELAEMAWKKALKPEDDIGGQ